MVSFAPNWPLVAPRGSGPARGGLTAPGACVEGERHAEAGGCGPQGFVGRVVVGAEVGVGRQQSRPEPEVGQTFQLGHGPVHVPL